MSAVVPVTFAHMISIKRLTRDDALMLSNIGGITLLQSHGHSAPKEVMQVYVDKAFSVDKCCKELEDGANIFHSINVDGEAVGYTKIILRSPHPKVDSKKVTMMERLYLLNGVFQRGLGEQLLQHAVELSKTAGDKGMWLTVWQKNERAIRFYEKHGFMPVGKGQFVLTETHANPTWIMYLQY